MIRPRLFTAAVLLSVALFVSFAGCSGRGADGDTGGAKSGEILAYVNGQAIRLADFESHFERVTAGHEPPAEDALSMLNARVAVLNQLVDKILVVQAAKKLNIRVTREEVENAVQVIRSEQPDGEFERALAEAGIPFEAWKRQLRETLLEEKVTKEVILPNIRVSEAAMQDYYRTHPGEFEQTLQIRGSQIMVATKEEAAAALGRLQQGADFAILAEEVSIAPERVSGGDLGWFGRGQMPTEFDEVFFSLPVGRPSEVIRTQYGFHIFLVTDRREPKVFTFDEARAEIERIVRHQRLDDEYRKWIASLREAADISINESLLGAET